MASTHSFITDADLHGLVDGHLEPDRRVDALRRLAAAPADRARVEAWQRQADLIRSTFAGVEHEPLPAALDLKTRPALHCVPAIESAVAPAAVDAPRRWPRFGTALATLIVVAAGLAGSWIFFDSDTVDEPIAAATLRGTVVAELADRASQSAAAPANPERTPATDAVLPTTRIPNLQPAGFAFVGADAGTAGPSSIVFRYRGSGDDRLVVSVARTIGDVEDTGAPMHVGNAFGWQRHGTAYAVAGTVRPARLRAIAVALQKDAASD